MPVLKPIADFEMYKRPERETDIDVLVAKSINAEVRSVRGDQLKNLWEIIRERLIEYLVASLDDATPVGSGRRYTAFRVDGVVMKFLYVTKANNIFMDGHVVRKSSSPDNIFATHQAEHELVFQYFRSMVLDTLFFRNDFPVNLLPQVPEITRVNPQNTRFLVQECVFDCLTVMDSLHTERAERREFRDGLSSFLTSYDCMRHEAGFVPEYPYLKGKNVLVGSDGRVWLCDTNHLVRTKTAQGGATREYRTTFSVPNINSTDCIMREIEQLILNLERGLLPQNPQG